MAADHLLLFALATQARLFKVPTLLHFTEQAFALQLFFQRAQRLFYVIIAYGNFHLNSFGGSGCLKKRGPYHPNPQMQTPSGKES